MTFTRTGGDAAQIRLSLYLLLFTGVSFASVIWYTL